MFLKTFSSIFGSDPTELKAHFAPNTRCNKSGQGSHQRSTCWQSEFFPHKYKHTSTQIQTHKHRMWHMQKIKVLKTRIFWHKTWNTQRAHATQLVKFLNKGQIGRNLFSLKHMKFHSKDIGTGNYNCVSTKHEQTMHLSGVGGWCVSMP